MVFLSRRWKVIEEKGVYQTLPAIPYFAIAVS